MAGVSKLKILTIIKNPKNNENMEFSTFCQPRSNYQWLKKTLMVMKLTVIMTIAVTLQINAAEHGNNTPNKIQHAAPVTVKGKVVDDQGLPLPGVTVKVKGTTTATVTNVDGAFQITAPDAKSTLVFSYIGFVTKEVELNGRTSLSVTLATSSGALGEVTVTALGIEKKTSDIGYSVTTVKGDEIERTNTVNPITALQGKVAGAVITTTTASGIQASPYIQIRGASALGGNNQPIFVIDGNVIENNISGPDGADAGSQLKNLNPDDYESITVLKGAAATSAYGSRGLHGAVVITTKGGKTKQGLGIEFSSSYQGADVYQSFMALQNTYGQGAFGREGAFATDGTQGSNRRSVSFGPAYDGTLHPPAWNPNAPTSEWVPYVAQPNNWKFFYQTNAPYRNNNITLSGGSEKTTYRISYSNTDATGFVPKNKLKRDALDIKISSEINKVLSTEVGVNYAHTSTSNYYNQGRYNYSSGQNLAFNTYYLPRNVDFASWYANYRNADNTTKPDPGFSGQGGSVVNAFTNLDKNNYQNNENSLLSYLQVKAQVNSWLDFSAKGNINYQANFAEQKNKGNGLNNAGGYYGQFGGNSVAYNLLVMGHATKKALHGDLSADLRVLGEYYGDGRHSNYSISTDGGLRIPNIFAISNSINPTRVENYDIGVGSAPQTRATIGTGAILNLNYKGYLNLELSARQDWISQLTYPTGQDAANNYGVFYPSINASYSFFDHYKDKMPEWLSSGRLRASLSYTGSQGILQPYTTGVGYNLGSFTDANGNTVPTASVINANVKPNPNLKPQFQRGIELGTNFSLLKDLITVDFAWYKTNTFDQLINVPTIIETGYQQRIINAGNIQNSGLELLVNVSPIRSKDWTLDIAVNLAHNQSKIIEFNPGIDKWNVGYGYDGVSVWAYKGGDFGVLASETWASNKLDPKTGYPIIQTNGRNTSTNPSTKYDFASYAYVGADPGTDAKPVINLGKVEPNLTGGINTTLRYKAFSLYTQVDARFGGLLYSEAFNYAYGRGTPLGTLKYRDQAHGGVARTDSYSGKTVYNGAIPNAVFNTGQVSPITGADISGMTFAQAYSKGLVESWQVEDFYENTYGWGTGINYNHSVGTNSWVSLREISLGYSLPSSIIGKIKFLRSARLNVTARNLVYLYNALPDKQNPESILGNNPFTPYIPGGAPFARTYAVSLHVKF